jgi:3-oxoacyl-[acyl-carrier-protein] synthase-3
MIINELKGIAIQGISCAVSTNWVSIESLKNGENDATLDKFVKTTSVQGHYECGPRQTAADLGCVAARRILEHKGIDPTDVGVLVYVTQYPDYRVPSTACVLQNRLGLPNDCIAFDVNLGCSGFVYGLNIVASLMQTGNARYGLLLAGDTPSKGVRSDNSRNLFGDASSATLLVKEEGAAPISIASCTDGAGYKAILRPYGYSKHPERPDTEGVFDEIDVFNFAINHAPALINELLEAKGMAPDDFDCMALHQANMMIMKQIVRRTHFDKEKVLYSIDRYANTSAASIPLCFVKKFGEDESKQPQRALICGYGVGLSWAAGIISLEPQCVMPIIETDEYFDDGLF